MKSLKLLLIALLCLSPALTQADFRGAWVATVFNINFPSSQGLSAAQQKQEIRNLVANAKAVGLNALVVQVRTESDALYKSRYEPWARWLTGRQGADPGYDPLETFIREGKRHGVEIHAWINPYRAAANKSHARSSSHPSKKFRSSLKTVRTMLWLDPGDPKVRSHIVRVVKDLVSRYDVDGVHMDDYFYPYPKNAARPEAFNDSATYKAYGRGMSRADWRRDNINKLIYEVSRAVKSERRSAKFGVSPFGIYTKGQPADVKAGVDQLNMLYADPLLWMRKGWVDYLAPQLYWPDKGPQSFSSLLKWWRDPKNNPRKVPIYPGIAVDRMTSHGWSSREIARQLDLEDQIGPRDGAGFLLWNMNAVMKNTKGVRKVIEREK